MAIKNWLMQNGMVTISFPADSKIIEGNFQDNENKVISGRINKRNNSITFSRVDYGKFRMKIIFLDQTLTNRVEVPIFHQPDWSRDRYEITSLKPFEYKVYSDGEFVN